MPQPRPAEPLGGDGARRRRVERAAGAATGGASKRRNWNVETDLLAVTAAEVMGRPRSLVAFASKDVGKDTDHGAFERPWVVGSSGDVASVVNSAEVRLQALKKLLDQGLIGQADFEQKKQAILAAL